MTMGCPCHQNKSYQMAKITLEWTPTEGRRDMEEYGETKFWKWMAEP